VKPPTISLTTWAAASTASTNRTKEYDFWISGQRQVLPALIDSLPSQCHFFDAARLLALFLRVARGSSLTFNLRLIAEHHAQQGTVNFNVAVVINKTQFPEFVHEKTHARSRRADHLRKCLLADFCYYWLRPTFLTKIRALGDPPA
jgi:hypothetical protein